MTVLAITLRPDGSLADSFVQKSSGFDELDQEAMKAFEKAQPFSNPPAALVENGAIRFTFGFTVTNEGFGGPLQFWRTGRP
jgi:TonB family protein